MAVSSCSRLSVLTSVLAALVLCSVSGIQSQDVAFKFEVVSPVNGVRVETDIPGGRVASFGSNGAFQIDGLVPLRFGGFLEVPGGRFAVTEGGQVGVDTVSPSSRLHVTAPASANPISAMTVDVDSFSTFSNAQASHFFRVRDIGANAPSPFMIRGDGNVGIGTDTPDERLTVTGIVQSTAGGLKFPDGTVQTTGGASTYTTTCEGGIVLGSSPGSLCHLNLPSATYLLEVTAMLFNTASDPFSNNNRTALCGFTGDLLYKHDIAGNADATLNLHAVLTVTSGGIDISCQSGQPGIIVFDRRFTAMQLNGPVVVQ